MNEFRLLEDERLRLRAVEPEDAKAIWSVESDSDQWRQNGMTAPFSMHNILRYAIEYDADPFTAGQLRLIACRRDTTGEWEQDVIGIIDLYEISALNKTAFVGIYVRPAFRKQGYAAEMLRILERYASEVLNIRILAVRVSSSNTGSLNLFANCGYERAGVLRHWLQSGNETNDLIIFEKCLTI